MATALGTQVIVALAFGAIGLIFSVLSNVFQILNNVRLNKYQLELEAWQRQQTRFENVEELMEVYKKPLVESANELQLRLSLLLLSRQKIMDNGERLQAYMLHSTLYLFGAFLGWLEVVRQEIVFVTGPRAEILNEVIDAIKFQFTGETPVQGVPCTAEGLEYSLESPWHILQLYHVELRAIGEVMLSERTYDNDKKDIKSTNLAVIGYAEFVRRFTMREPTLEEFTANGCDYANFREAKDHWDASKEKLLQENLRPLTLSVRKWMELQPESRPTERIAMLQVLLCKLIDFLDDGVECSNSDSSSGARGGRRGGRPPVPERFLSRNEWLSPKLDHLRLDALMWLWDRPFMMDCVDLVDPVRRRSWLSLISAPNSWMNVFGEEVPLGVFRKLAFPGFREDLQRRCVGAGGGRRNTVGGSPYLAAAFPPKAPTVSFMSDPKYYLQIWAPYLWAMLTCKALHDGGPLQDPFRCSPYVARGPGGATGGGGGCSGGGGAAPAAAAAVPYPRLSAVPPLSPPPAAHPRPLYINPVANI
ncbi:hypothetical protein VaNZ11_016149 [Volvox africanus]|uniref:Uncharacterized protein n=1 Tax=Volvox africanus TaxID=51714 RepID=A0ABQ5SNR0_9CHLO|nr:hypothetical protein VaNZ11_016149 [Volvox africanus]